MKICPHAEKYTPRGAYAIIQTMNEETMQAARAAWRRNPEDAAMAMLGVTPEELFVQAIRGCNQHGHKQGCPDADGSSIPDRGNAYKEVQRALDKVAREDKGVQKWQPKQTAVPNRGSGYKEVQRTLDKAAGRENNSDNLPGNAAEYKAMLEKDVARLKKEMDAEDEKWKQGKGSLRVWLALHDQWLNASAELKKMEKQR